ncbi:acyl-CoA dehydrogenase family protein [Henriciella sp. AS95]|uniref:acyl-CoA dehydrogenase family protein n=1 Tax=Henriciella sp. AS95 TaxID=3135782 RepID=UPI0031749EA3
MNAFTDISTRMSAGGSRERVSIGFRREVDHFLHERLTEDLRQAGRDTTGLKSDPVACSKWRAILYEKGWLAPAWPKAYGGPGWSAEQQLYFENACAENDAPVLMSSGIRTIGPLIMQAGSTEQQARYLPPILRGEHEWCQGFSEPQAGSDLPALGLKAERDGNVFVLNGSKLWTSFAHQASHMYLLARSDAQSSGRDGLVFLLVEMDLPGISVRPIRCLDGTHEVSEVFFDNVRTPAADRIGDIDDGWTVARTLMQIARSNNTTTGTLRRAWRAAARHVKEVAPGEMTILRQLNDLACRIEEFEALQLKVETRPPSCGRKATSSLMKLTATELHQAITELAIQAAPHNRLAQSKYFATRAATIYSGTSEIHRNTIAWAIGCP